MSEASEFFTHHTVEIWFHGRHHSTLNVRNNRGVSIATNLWSVNVTRDEACAAIREAQMNGATIVRREGK